jgi:hypothetical protein
MSRAASARTGTLRTGAAPTVLMGQWLSERLGQPFVIDNRPGAGTNIAAEAVVSALADGHMLLMIGTAYAINATLYEKPNFKFIRDIAQSPASCAPALTDLLGGQVQVTGWKTT